MVRERARATLILTLAGSVASVACGGMRLAREPAAYGAPTAEAAVRAFLDAAAEGDYPRMGRVFGTRRGPAESRLGVEEVEKRMVVLAGVLAVGAYEVTPSRLTEPDRRRRRFTAALEGRGGGRVEVPVVAVRARAGRWFVERLETEPLATRSR